MDSLLHDRRVLVVEDEMLVLMSIECMLEELGCRSVTTVATIEGALELLDSHLFDLAMLDINLSGANSYPVADALVTHGVPFVFSTGYGDNGPTNYPNHQTLTKPYPLRALSQALASLLAD